MNSSKLWVVPLIVMLVLLNGCSEQLQGEKITEEIMHNYISALESIRESNPEFLKKIGTLNFGSENIEKATKALIIKAGFSDQDEFRSINGKILTIYRSLNRAAQPEARLKSIESVQKSDQQALDAILADPEISEIRKSEILAIKEKVAKAHNVSMAHLRDETMDDPSYTFDDKDSIEVVRKYQSTLEELLPPTGEKAQSLALESLKSKFEQESNDKQEAVIKIKKGSTMGTE